MELMAQAMEIYVFRHAMLFILQSHYEICSSCEVQENQLMTRESFVLPFQNEIVGDTSIGQVAEVDGSDEQVMYSEPSFVSDPTPVLDWAFSFILLCYPRYRLRTPIKYR